MDHYTEMDKVSDQLTWQSIPSLRIQDLLPSFLLKRKKAVKSICIVLHGDIYTRRVDNRPNNSLLYL